MQAAEDSWWWEEDQIFHEEEVEDPELVQQSTEQQPEQIDAVKSKTRSVTAKNPLRVTSERLLGAPNGFKYIRTSFSRLRQRLVGTKESVSQDSEVVLEFYNEWLHHLQPKYSPEVVAQQVERECKSRVMRAYLSRVKALESGDDFDETVHYALPKQQDEGEPAAEQQQTSLNEPEITEEMRRKIEQNKFDAQQRLLRRMEQLSEVVVGEESNQQQRFSDAMQEE